MSGWMGIPWQKDRTWVGSSGWGAGLSPSLNLVFNSTPIDPRITFTRASSGTYYDGSTTMAEQNLLKYSQVFQNAAWIQTSLTAADNSTAAPDGTSTASTLTAGAGSSYHWAYQVISITANTTFAYSIYAKAGAYSFMTVNMESSVGTSWISATINTSTGAVTKTGTGTSDTLISATATSVGSGWYRIVLVGSLTTAPLNALFQIASSGTPTYAAYGAEGPWSAAGTETIYLWGAQLEQRSSATVYTPTTSSAVTNFLPVMQTAANDTPRIDTDIRPNFNGTGTVSSNTIVLPATFADGSAPYPKDGWYNGQSITVAGSPFTVSGYVASSLTLTLSGSPTAGSQVFSLGNPNQNQRLGLLVEESRVNSCLQSNDFTQAAWAKTNSTITSAADVAPDGTLTAQAIVDTATNAAHSVTQNVTTTAAAWTASVMAKANGRNFIYWTITDNGSVARSVFYNLSTGTIGTTGTGITASIVSVGNGFFRCIATIATALAGSNPFVLGTCSADNTPSYAGNAFSGAIIWGSQIELGAFATSLNVTTASTATRAADSASMTGSNFSSWWNPSQGSFYSEASSNSSSALARIIVEADDGTSFNRILLQGQPSSTTSTFVVIRANSTIVATNITNSLNTGMLSKLAASWINTGYDFCANSNIGSHVGAAALPTGINALRIGDYLSGGASVNGTIKRLSYYPVALSSTQLQNLTKL